MDPKSRSHFTIFAQHYKRTLQKNCYNIKKLFTRTQTFQISVLCKEHLNWVPPCLKKLLNCRLDCQRTQRYLVKEGLSSFSFLQPILLCKCESLKKNNAHNTFLWTCRNFEDCQKFFYAVLSPVCKETKVLLR